MSHGRRPTGVVLTGGSSSRMGADKAFVMVDGRPMAIRVVDALREGGCGTVVCQGGDVDGLRELGLDAYADTSPGDGPIAAIVDALQRIDGAVLVAACDLPDLDAASVQAVIAAASGSVAPVLVGEADGRRHLLSYWNEGAVAALVQVRADGARSYHDALDRIGAVGLPVPAAAVRNVNHPDDLR